ncbi:MULTISPECIES: hypothetical protein [unclassified Prochlorococcus]|nr:MULTISPECIES: hypothetical protein [unclassified Prochlorococcus]KGG15508.1 hypothetical protein EV06_1382 [Prochlorococcus sp. MIT 0602]KGG17789.1 hypothetical protein EV07_1230 [Prochlorococcus sp. MIT 0603]
MGNYPEISIPFYIAMFFIALLFLEDSGDDDDEGGGLMQPVYEGQASGRQ